jgi:hypothetical protein
MFNKKIIGSERIAYVPYEKEVTINRAPTDESIKLYDEYLQKTIDRIIDSFVIKHNILNDIQVFAIVSPIGFTTEVCFKFNLNGKEFKLRKEVEKYSREDAIFEIFKHLTTEINKILYEELIKIDELYKILRTIH